MYNNTKAKNVRHGELILKAVDKVPSGAVLKEETSSKIVAWSETHHHHILSVKDKVDMSKIKVYAHNGDTYVEVPAIAELWHQKSGKDVHKKHTIAPAVYKIVIKKEFDYYKGAIRVVRD
jgi:hypothetical protein